MLDRTAPKAPIDILRKVAIENGVKSHRLFDATNYHLKAIRNRAVEEVIKVFPDISRKECAELFGLSEEWMRRHYFKITPQPQAPDTEELRAAIELFCKENDVEFKYLTAPKKWLELRVRLVLKVINEFPQYTDSEIARIFNFSHSYIGHVRSRYGKSTVSDGNKS